MQSTISSLVISLLVITTDQFVNCQIGHARVEQIDQEGKYFVSWRIAKLEPGNSTGETSSHESKNNSNSIVFQIDVETHGYIGFGISPKGGMMGADILIAGVYPNGTSYFRDAFGVGNQEPVLAESCNWKLIEAWENETHTHLQFSRLLDTCDVQDVVIQNDTNHLIWAIGETDELKYHRTRRGSYSVHLLDPPLPELDISKFKTWRMSYTFEMPANSTTYWCTIHKSPSLSTKHHIVGFRPVLPTPEAVRHTHHFLVHECSAPPGQDQSALFDPYVNSGTSGLCYDNFNMSQYCRTYLFVWGAGGKMTLFPEHVGFPIGENGHPCYFMLEIHYDNPKQLSRIKFEAGIEFFYTSELRKYGSGFLTLGHILTFALTIPPESSDFAIVGHCSPDCTNKMPEKGIKVFNVILHSHLAGRKLRVKHFRNGTELPWLASDDNYSFDYQQNRPLREEVAILPGDQLTVECKYETKGKKNATIGGLSTNEEMCYAFLWYYPRISLRECLSSVSQHSVLEEFGIKGIKWNGNNDPLVTEPTSLANKSYTEVLDTAIDWSPDRRSRFQTLQRDSKHHIVCQYQETGENRTIAYQIGKDTSIAYPANVVPYESPKTCAEQRQTKHF